MCPRRICPTTTPRTRPHPYMCPRRDLSHPRPHLAPDHSHTCVPRRDLSHPRPHLAPDHSHTCVPGEICLGYAGGSRSHEPHGPRAGGSPARRGWSHGFGSWRRPKPIGRRDCHVAEADPRVASLAREFPQPPQAWPPQAPCTSASRRTHRRRRPSRSRRSRSSLRVLVRHLEFRRAGWPGTSVPARLSPADIEPGSAGSPTSRACTAGNTRGQRGKRIRQVLARAHVMPQGVISGSQTRPQVAGLRQRNNGVRNGRQPEPLMLGFRNRWRAVSHDQSGRPGDAIDFGHMTSPRPGTNAWQSPQHCCGLVGQQRWLLRITPEHGRVHECGIPLVDRKPLPVRGLDPNAVANGDMGGPGGLDAAQPRSPATRSTDGSKGSGRVDCLGVSIT